MLITTQQQTRIRKHLPKGWRHKIAKECNCGEVLVSDVMNGRVQNIEIAQAIISLAEQQKSHIEETSKDLEKRVQAL